MSYQNLVFQGSVSLSPPVGMPSGQPSVAVSWDEAVGLIKQLSNNVTLSSDSAASLSLGSLTAVNFVAIRTLGGKVRVRLTSSDGSAQAFPVDPYLVLCTSSVNITAIDVTRVASTETEVFYVIGQRG